MSKYLLIESRDPFEVPDVRQLYDLANDLDKQGNTVTLYLVQDAVIATRSGAKSGSLADLAKQGKVKILADDFSLSERGIQKNSLHPGITVSNTDQLVDLLIEEGQKAIWH